MALEPSSIVASIKQAVSIAQTQQPAFRSDSPLKSFSIIHVIYYYPHADCYPFLP